MEPEQIIKHVHKYFRHYWHNECNLDCTTFQELLQPHWPKLSPTQYSRLTNGGKSPAKLIEVLGDPIVLARIEGALEIPGLFSCQTRDEIDRLLTEKAFGHLRETQQSSPSDCLMIPDLLLDERVPLNAREERTVKQLLSLIMQGTSNILCWTDPPTVGASFLAYTLSGVYLPRDGVTSSFLIQPYPGICEAYLHECDDLDAQPFAQALRDLSQHLGLAGRPNASTLFNALVSSRSVLFVLQADDVPESSRRAHSDLAELLQEARIRPPRPRGEPVPIVLIGRPAYFKPSQRVLSLGDQRDSLAFGARSSRERDEFFEQQWYRFCKLRENVIVDDAGGVRLKRARQYYNADAGSIVWPSTLRVLAFFASNHENFSYFDPTAGWMYLAGASLEDLPIDIRLHLLDVVHQARNIPEDGMRTPTLRAVRWCSTAVYWLTEEAAEVLGKLPPRTLLSSFRAAVDRVPGLVDVINHNDDRPPVYKMDMALRAVIQERWACKDPLAGC